jgi:hypothetical protein
MNSTVGMADQTPEDEYPFDSIDITVEHKRMIEAIFSVDFPSMMKSGEAMRIFAEEAAKYRGGAR